MTSENGAKTAQRSQAELTPADIFDLLLAYKNAAHASAVASPTARLMADVLGPWAGRRDRLDVLDLACGHGLYGYTLAQRHPQARIWSLDWPDVLPPALVHARKLGVADQVSTIAGDMFAVDLGGPYDVVMITNVLHHFSEERAALLLRRAAQVIAPDGRIVLVGFTTSDAPPAEEAAAHLFSILMLIWTRAGEVHSGRAYERMLAGAGFSDVEPLAFDRHPITLAAIRAQLGGTVTQVLVATGDSPRSRQRVEQVFARDSRAHAIALCSEALNEGLNLQGAAALVHLDLPTTLRVAEQRVGRVDRMDNPHDRCRHSPAARKTQWYPSGTTSRTSSKCRACQRRSAEHRIRRQLRAMARPLSGRRGASRDRTLASPHATRARSDGRDDRRVG